MGYLPIMRKDELKRLRDRLGVTQRVLAEEVGVHPMTVSKWETGASRIPEPVARLVQRMDTERGATKRKR